MQFSKELCVCAGDRTFMCFSRNGFRSCFFPPVQWKHQHFIQFQECECIPRFSGKGIKSAFLGLGCGFVLFPHTWQQQDLFLKIKPRTDTASQNIISRYSSALVSIIKINRFPLTLGAGAKMASMWHASRGAFKEIQLQTAGFKGPIGQKALCRIQNAKLHRRRRMHASQFIWTVTDSYETVDASFDWTKTQTYIEANKLA